jgi:hypothetical protein
VLASLEPRQFDFADPRFLLLVRAFGDHHELIEGFRDRRFIKQTPVRQFMSGQRQTRRSTALSRVAEHRSAQIRNVFCAAIAN